VGRHAERTLLAEAWQSVGAGARRAVFVCGEPGAGKSRLIVELCTELERHGAAVLVGSCVAELGPPYQPFDGPVGALRDGVVDGTLTPADPDAWPVPLIAERLSTLVGRAVTHEPAVATLEEQRDVYGALTLVLTELARQKPTVLVLEDLHWAGSTSLQLLTHVVERTAGRRVLVLASYRTTAPDQSDELVRRLAPLYRLDGVTRVDLGPLDTDDIAEYLVREARVAGYRARHAAGLLRERTGGNPFYLRELWRDLGRRGGLAGLTTGSQRAPEIVRDTVHHRLAALAPEHQEALRLAAVLGEEFDAATLVAASGSSDVLHALDAFIASGLLESIDDSDSRYGFVHSLTRRAVLDLTSTAQRTRLHEMVAITLERRGGSVQQLAHHYAAAHVLGHTRKAVRYLVAAAASADASLAHADAGRLLERAADVCDDPLERDGHRLAAARSYQLACEFQKARDLLLIVANEGEAASRLRAAIAYEDSAWYTASAGTEALVLLESAMRAAPADPSEPEYVRSFAGLGRALALTGSHGRAEELVTHAIALARESKDERLLGDALSASLQVDLRIDGHNTKLARAVELAGIAARTGNWLLIGPSAYYRAVIGYHRGDRAAVEEARRDLRRPSESTGQQYWTYLLGCVDFGLRLIAGDFTAALQISEGLLELGEQFGGAAIDGPYGVQSFMLRRETGEVEGIRPFVTGTEAPDDHWPPALLALYVELGMAGPAARVLRHILDRDLPVEMESPRWPATLAFLAEAATALNDADAASRIGPLLDEYAGLNIVMGPFIAVFGAADRYRAQLHAICGTGSPTDLFGSALELDRRTGSAVHEAATLAAWAGYARRTGDIGQARTLEMAAAGLATPRNLVRVMNRLPARELPAERHPDGLTGREAEVLRLLGAGLSNRELAKRLTISESTAANHVRSILLKTGCANRTQAARYAVDHGLID
jgi:DNA-binding CsgD family transcriptional regulator